MLPSLTLSPRDYSEASQVTCPWLLLFFFKVSHLWHNAFVGGLIMIQWTCTVHDICWNHWDRERERGGDVICRTLMAVKSPQIFFSSENKWRISCLPPVILHPVSSAPPPPKCFTDWEFMPIVYVQPLSA